MKYTVEFLKIVFKRLLDILETYKSDTGLLLEILIEEENIKRGVSKEVFEHLIKDLNKTNKSENETFKENLNFLFDLRSKSKKLIFK
jgi:N-acetylneuraminic acid mutarotase